MTNVVKSLYEAKMDIVWEICKHYTEKYNKDLMFSKYRNKMSA